MTPACMRMHAYRSRELTCGVHRVKDSLTAQLVAAAFARFPPSTSAFKHDTFTCGRCAEAWGGWTGPARTPHGDAPIAEFGCCEKSMSGALPGGDAPEDHAAILRELAREGSWG